MASENETYAEIVREMGFSGFDKAVLPYLDRIRAVHEREIARLRRHYQDMLKRIALKDKGDRHGER